MSTIPPLPGGVGLTHLQVYDSPAPDGLRGGSPHLHLCCTEAYYVLNGRGRVQTLDTSGFAEWPLEPGGVVWFSPGVIHRLINEDGALEILVVMANAGLPEAGDFVLTFAPDILADPARYFELASLSPRGEVFASGDAAAQRRRDWAVEGFAVWRREFEKRGAAALDEFYTAAQRLIAPKLDTWRETWERGPLAAVQATGAQLAVLAAGDVTHLRQGAVAAWPAPADERKRGMCGTLGTYWSEGVLLAPLAGGQVRAE
ncbi:MAG: cupin domain-containing protein [Armatimonadota bacterium]|nr:cupin domain-containing protein [Armatimonadota bacterium]